MLSSLEYRAKSYGKVCDDTDSESDIDYIVEMNIDGIYDVSAKVKIVDAGDLNDLSSDDDDDEKMDDVDLVPENYMPSFRAQEFPEIKTKAQLTYRQLFSPTMPVYGEGGVNDDAFFCCCEQ